MLYSNAVIYVPNALLNNEVFKGAIEKWQTKILNDITSIDLKEIPPALLTQEICNRALKIDIDVLPYIPKKYRDYRLLTNITSEKYLPIQLIENSKENKSHTLEESQLHKLYLEAITKFPFYMEDVPESLLNQEFCNAAIKENIDVLQYTPKKYKTYKLFESVLIHEDSAKFLVYLDKTTLLKK